MRYTEEQFDPKVIQHLDLVLKHNQITNLTSIKDRNEGILLHVEDSLHGLIEIQSAPIGPYADLGTGGGFPGIPLAISTGRDTTLVDSVRKKVDCLNSMIKDLGLSSTVSTYWGRIEELANSKRNYYSVITARALTQLGSLLELSSPLLKKGGWLICYKAHISQEEMDLAISLEDKLGMKKISYREFTLSDETTERCIVVFEKTHEAKIKLPRKVSFAQKKPLQP